MARKWAVFFHPVLAFLGNRNIRKLRNLQLALKGLWDGRLARPNWAGKMPAPQEIKSGYLLLTVTTVLICLLASPSSARTPIAPSHPLTIAQNPPASPTEAHQLDKTARQQYIAKQFDQAATNFQKAAELYQAQGDKLRQAISLSNLSLTYQQLGTWERADQAISESLKLLETELQSQNIPDRQLAYAQALDTRAQLDLAQGRAEQAIDTWKRTETIYQQLGNAESATTSQINQARSLQTLGLYSRASLVLQKILQTPTQKLLLQDLSSLDPLEARLKALPATPTTVATLRSLGETLQVIGDLAQAKQIVNYSLSLAEALPSSETTREEAIAAAHLSLGNLIRAQAIAKLKLNNLTVKEASAQLQKRLSPVQKELQYSRTQTAEAFKTETKEALNSYQQAADGTSSASLKVQAYLNRLTLLLDRQEIAEAEAIITQLYPLLDRLPLIRATIDAQLSLAQSLMRMDMMRVNSSESGNSGSNPASAQLLPAARLLATAHQQAKDLGNAQAESFALGNLGELYQYTQQWPEAETLTKQALEKVQAVSVNNLPFAVNDADLAYRWQRQLGQIRQAQGDRDGAIKVYEEALKTLQKRLRLDVASSNLSYKFSFREAAQQPVHLELMDLLLQSEQPAPKELQRVREVSSSLLEAELTSFLQEPCQVVTPQQVDKIVAERAETAAIFYPVILPNSLEVIVKLPNVDQLLHYRHRVSQVEVLKNLSNLQTALEEDYTFEAVEDLSKQFYDWLVKPAKQQLEANHVDTLVFTLDRSLQSIPMSALYDGEQYLIEKYAVSEILGLKFDSSDRSLQPEELKVIAAGLSIAPNTEKNVGGQDIQGLFPPLSYVKDELEIIKGGGVRATILMDKDFTLEKFNTRLNEEKFPVVHLATHGQFSFDPKRTFLLTADGLVDVDQLSALFRVRGQIKLDAIELLIVNACETAAGDDLATLGIAGAAVRAGARSAIASLWTLDDAPSVLFTQEFYKRLQIADFSKAEALRQAQLVLLQDPQYKHPRYWSPYILAGNWLPLTTSRSVGSADSRA